MLWYWASELQSVRNVRRPRCKYGLKGVWAEAHSPGMEGDGRRFWGTRRWAPAELMRLRMVSVWRPKCLEFFMRKRFWDSGRWANGRYSAECASRGPAGAQQGPNRGPKWTQEGPKGIHMAMRFNQHVIIKKLSLASIRAQE